LCAFPSFASLCAFACLRYHYTKHSCCMSKLFRQLFAAKNYSPFLIHPECLIISSSPCWITLYPLHILFSSDHVCHICTSFKISLTFARFMKEILTGIGSLYRVCPAVLAGINVVTRHDTACNDVRKKFELTINR